MTTNPNDPQGPGPRPHTPGYQPTQPLDDPGAPVGPPPGAGPAYSGPTGGPPPKKKSRGKLIGLLAVGLVALLVVILVGTELFFRNRAESCLADNIKNGTQASDVQVSFAKTPMLVQQISGKLPSINIQADGINATPGLSANIELKGVTPGGDNRIDSANIVGSLSKEGIVNKVLETKVITSPTVNLNTSTNEIEITGTAVLFPISLNLKPELRGNEVTLTASKVSVLGFGVPDDLSQQVTSSVSGGLPSPKGLTAKDLTMTDQAITLTYSGTDVRPQDIESGNSVGASDCSVF